MRGPRGPRCKHLQGMGARQAKEQRRRSPEGQPSCRSRVLSFVFHYGP